MKSDTIGSRWVGTREQAAGAGERCKDTAAIEQEGCRGVWRFDVVSKRALGALHADGGNREYT
jgi:hypothetical protein